MINLLIWWRTVQWFRLNDVWQKDKWESWNKLPDAPWSGRGMQINSCVDDNGFMGCLVVPMKGTTSV
ncbi:MAG: hypothetical protein IPL12_10365 [Bacteroidetes bacterium]|nr:hypothetical protein [Bacteroidota bacterium]